MWIINNKGEKEFTNGNMDFAGAETEAKKCIQFKADIEEEQVADEPVSCYNCVYRRWTSASFVCCNNSAHLNE